MRSYRCYCHNEIATIEMIHCAYDVEATQRADDLLVQSPELHGVEAWVGPPRLRQHGGNRGRGVAQAAVALSPI